MDYKINKELYQNIRAICLEHYAKNTNPIELLHRIWELPDFPMHCPEHHFLIPAVLLTTYCRFKNDTKEHLEVDLTKAEERARNLLPGFCGWYGACGAAVGSGIFLSLLTNTSPYSSNTWSLANLITSDCLKEIARIGGPRCCKRVSYTSVITSTQFMKKHMNMDIGTLPDIKCIYHDNNKECKKKLCPYYPEAQ